MHKHSFSARMAFLGLALVCFAQFDSKAAIQLWSANSAVKVFPDAHKPIDSECKITVRMARSEYEECQIILRSDQDINNVTVKLDSLTSSNKLLFSKSDIKYRFVGTTQISKSSPVASRADLLCTPPAEVPDVLIDKPSIRVNAGSSQAIWFTFHTPESITAGKYTGHFSVIADGNELDIPVEVEVLPFGIPAERHLLTSVFFNYRAFADTYGVELWSDRFFELVKPYAKNMAEHRINVLQAEEHYWGHPFSNSIEFYLDEKGELECDFSKCDRLINLMMDSGVNDRIEFFFTATFESWEKPNVLLRKIWARPRKGGELVELSPDEGLRPYLQQLQEHLSKKGWLDKSMIHISDEPIQENFDSWIAASRFVRAAAPKLRRIDAVCTIGFGDDLDVHVAKLNDYFTWREYYKDLGCRDKEIWLYTCGQPWGHELPNRFLDEPLVNVRLLHWLNWYTQTKGYLHWALCFWEKGKDPYRYTEDRYCPGDQFIVYPGPNGPLDSIRWEQMRAGLEDFEMLWLLTDKMKQVKQRLGNGALHMDPAEASNAICRRVIKEDTTYAGPDELIQVRRELQDEILSALQSPLIMLKCTPSAGSKLYYGPWNVILSGVTEIDADVFVNGKPVRVDENGKFCIQVKSSNSIRIEVEKSGARKRFLRTFAVAKGAQPDYFWIPEETTNTLKP